MDNRIYGKLDKAVSMGYNLTYLYGDVSLLKDKFFYNLEKGFLDINQTLKSYFINKKKYDYYVNYNSDGVLDIYNSKDRKIDFEEFVNEKVNGFTPQGFDDEEEEKREKTNFNGENSFANIVSQIEDKIKDKSIKIGFYIKDYEYIAKLYEEADITQIKILEDLYKYRNLTTVVSMKNPMERMAKFDINMDEKDENLIKVSYPSQQEVFNSFLYRLLIEEKEVELDLLEIADNLSTVKRTLKEQLNILDRILKSNKEVNLESFKEDLNKSIDEEVFYEDVILNEDIKESLDMTLEEFIVGNMKAMRKGMILTGPPGTGKTFLVKALANKHNMYFSAPSLAELKGKYVGQSSGKVKDLFDELRSKEPAILFLDELDSVFSIRGGEQSDSFTNDIVNQFLVEIDGVKTGEQKIFIIGATNRIETVDLAIKSRLGDPIEIPLPNAKARTDIFNSKFNKFKISDLELLKERYSSEFIKKTEGFSGRDIDNFVKELRRDKPNEKFKLGDFEKLIGLKEKEYKNNFLRIMKNSIDVRVPNPVKIIGYEEIIKQLEEECNYIKASNLMKDRLENYNIEIKRGNILYGPPGNGKTELASYIANKHNFNLIRVLSKNFTSLSPEDTLKKLKEIFENTFKLSNITSKSGVVLFFDEIETLVGKGLNPQVRGTLLDYLQNKEELRNRNSKIIFLGATNFFEGLDEASIRAGRVDRKIRIDNPLLKDYLGLLLNFWKSDVKVEARIEESSNILENTIDTFILQNLRSKNIIEKITEVYLYRGTSEEDIREKVEDFMKKDAMEKLKEIKDLQLNIYSVSDIKNLANEIKAFAFYENFIENNKVSITEDVLEDYIKDN